MKKNPGFDLVEVAGEHLAVPVGEQSKSFHGVIALSKDAAYLLERMEEDRAESEIIALLTENFDITPDVATADFQRFLQEVVPVGLIEM